MGTYGTLAKQSAALVVLTAAIAVAAGVLGSAEAALWATVTGLAVLAFFVAVSVRRHREVMRLASEVDEVLHGGRSIDFSDYREGDIAALSNELAKMTARLQRTADLLASERSALADALADISHQVRTPLTAMNLMLSAIEHADDEGERHAVVRKLEHMIDRVGWLVTALLRLARADAGALQVARAPVRAEAMIRRGVAPLEAAFDLRGVDLAIDVDSDVSFKGDECWTAEALENIVKNALGHTPAGGRVTISAREDALATIIAVTDTGSGIAAADLPHVFERFYRRCEDEDEQVSPDEGFGIGLALAQALVSVQGGTLRASNEPGAGACFEIAFPKLVV